MALGNFTSNQGTQTPIVVDTIGGGSVMAIQKIDLSPLGASGTIWSGGVSVTSGTINSDTVIGGTLNNIGTLLGIGTLTNLGSLTNIGTLPQLVISSGSINGTVNIGNTPNIGTIGTLGLGTITGNLGTIGTLGLGTITGNLGTIGTLGLGSVVVNSLPNLPQGSIQVTAGTIASVGTIGTLGLGTITGNLGTLGTIGTINNIGSLTNIGTLPNLPGGSVAVTAGTINSGTINAGTFVYTGGTLNLIGTLQVGTVQINQLPTQAMTAYGTMGTQASGTTFFTIQGTVGSGTEVVVSNWSIVVMAGTCGASLSFGTNGGSFVQGTGVIAAGSFPMGGGIATGVESALNSGTNGAIYAGLYGNGTAYYQISYYKATTTV